MKNTFYERHVEDYQRFTDLYFPKRHLTLISLIENSSPERVLDIGCGTGVMLERLGEKFPQAQLMGVDLSSPMIDHARQTHPTINFQVADAMKLPFEDNSFDVATNAISFHHYSDPQKAIDETYRVLKPDGQFLLMDITPKNNYIRKLHDFGARHIVRDGHNAFQSLSGIKELFENSGFTRLQQQQIGRQAVYVTCGFKTHFSRHT